MVLELSRYGTLYSSVNELENCVIPIKDISIIYDPYSLTCIINRKYTILFDSLDELIDFFEDIVEIMKRNYPEDTNLYQKALDKLIDIKYEEGGKDGNL